MRTDMRMDMCTAMCTDVCIEMCADMRRKNVHEHMQVMCMPDLDVAQNWRQR